MPVNFQLIDLSPYADDITGYVSFLETSVGPLHPPTRIRNKWHCDAVFGYQNLLGLKPLPLGMAFS